MRSEIDIDEHLNNSLRSQKERNKAVDDGRDDKKLLSSLKFAAHPCLPDQCEYFLIGSSSRRTGFPSPGTGLVVFFIWSPTLTHPFPCSYRLRIPVTLCEQTPDCGRGSAALQSEREARLRPNSCSSSSPTHCCTSGVRTQSHHAHYTEVQYLGPGPDLLLPADCWEWVPVTTMTSILSHQHPAAAHLLHPHPVRPPIRMLMSCTRGATSGRRQRSHKWSVCEWIR